jgi:hypothetical protein
MREFNGTDFKRTGNNISFGPLYCGYGAIQLQHTKSGVNIDIVIDGQGKELTHPDAITDALRNGFKIGADHLKIVPIKIDGQQQFVIKWPNIIF